MRDMASMLIGICKNLLLLIILNGTLHEHNVWKRAGVHGALATAGDSAVNASGATLPQRPLPVRLPPPSVKLNKCCHFGDHLDTSSRACVGGNTALWLPRIFQINRKTFYVPVGGSPKFITFEENVRPVADAGCSADELQLFTGSSNLVIYSDGSLLLQDHQRVVERQRYCIDREAALVCFPGEHALPPRLQLHKCCGKYLTYNALTNECSDAGERGGEVLKLPVDESAFQTLYGFPKCPGNSTLYSIVGDWSEEQLHAETGRLLLHQRNLSSNDYCLEHLRDGNASTTNTTIKIFACQHHFAAERSDRIQLATLSICLIISVVFLAATLVAGCLMPSVHHVLHWRCQIYYVFCLFVGDLLFACMQLWPPQHTESLPCVLLASATHFFFLAAFFWLNTMCFNIWWTFRDFRPSSLERNQELLRLRLYSVYAWGIPLLISFFAACVNQFPDTDLLRPGFGERNCWFSDEHLTIFAYFFGPIGVLLCINIVLFCSTTHQLTCGLWKRDDVKSTTEKTALGVVCLKLVVVMGVTWIVDVLSWLVGGPHAYWFLADLVNALVGVFIFLVVGCQPQVWTACKRFCCPRSRQEITNTTNGVQHSSSSQGLPSMGACGGAEITQNTSIHTTIGGTHAPAKIPMETVC